MDTKSKHYLMSFQDCIDTNYAYKMTNNNRQGLKCSLPFVISYSLCTDKGVDKPICNSMELTL